MWRRAGSKCSLGGFTGLQDVREIACQRRVRLFGHVARLPFNIGLYNTQKAI